MVRGPVKNCRAIVPICSIIVSLTAIVVLQAFTSHMDKCGCGNAFADDFSFPLHNGFPVQVAGRLQNSVTVIDCNRDGFTELCFNVNGKTYLLNSDGGNFNTAWPKSGGYYYTPAIGYVDDDRHIEIVTAGPDTKLSVYDLDGQMKMGWPYAFPEGYARDTLTVMDLDGDGRHEVVVGFGYSTDNLTIVDQDGVALPGYPLEVEDTIFYHPGIADLDSDGRYEIIIGFWGVGHKRLIAHDLSGNIFQGNWTVDLEGLGLGGLNSSITVADIDGDKRPEIMFATDLSPSVNHAVVLNHDRTFATGWPKVLYHWIHGGFSVGDIDGDGKLEIAGVTSGHAEGTGPYISRLYVWNGEDGSDVPGWPQDILNLSCVGQQVIIGDLDGDCDSELLVAGHDNALYLTQVLAFHHDGQMVDGFPLTISGFLTLGYNSCFIADIDNDGLVEIGIGVNDGTSFSRIYVWDLPFPYKAECQDWPQFRHDAQHTGNYHFPGGLPIFRPVPAMGWPGLLLLVLLMGLAIRRHTAYDAGRRRKTR